jgi:DNA adenine methylase
VIETVGITPPLKWHGGKNYLASKIHAIASVLKPGVDYIHRVHPYAGGLGELWVWEYEGVSEVVNDLNRGLTNFWNVMRSETEFNLFARLCSATPFSEELFNGIGKDASAPNAVDAAWRFFIRCRQSMSGRMKDFAAISRTRTRRGMNEQCSAWLNAVEGLPAVHARLSRVLILNRPALDVIRSEDTPKTLFYCDPPYLHETRATTGEYAHEMTREQHEQLLAALAGIKGKFMLSGYDSELYRQAETANGWRRHEFDLPNNAAGGDTKRRMKEIVWTNFWAQGGAD